MLTIIYANHKWVKSDDLTKIEILLNEKGIKNIVVIESHDEIYPIKIDQIKNTPQINKP